MASRGRLHLFQSDHVICWANDPNSHLIYCLGKPVAGFKSLSLQHDVQSLNYGPVSDDKAGYDLWHLQPLDQIRSRLAPENKDAEHRNAKLEAW